MLSLWLALLFIPVCGHLLLCELVEIGFVSGKQAAAFLEGKYSHEHTGDDEAEGTNSRDFGMLGKCCLHHHQTGIVGAMKENRYTDDAELIEPRLILRCVALIVDERIIIAHRHGKEEVGGNRQQSASYSYLHPVGVLNEIDNILQSCKAETDTDSIDDTVEIFVIVFVVAQQQPEHQQLASFLRDSRVDKCIPQRPCHRIGVERDVEHHQKSDDNQRRQGSQTHTLKYLAPRLMLISVHEIDEQ